MAYISYEKYKNEYQKLWDTMRIIRDAKALHRISEKIKKYKSVYEKVEKETSVPWQMVAVIHIREAGESDVGKWKGVLHNGEKIVGTGRKTKLVPSGRGPFNTWHAAAVHALREKGFHRFTEWPVSRILWALEPFNGYGYRNRGLRSPYLWASTNHQQYGKYVADHVFDANVIDKQIGCAAQLKFLELGNKARVVPVISSPVGITAVAGVAAAGALVAPLVTDYTWPILIGTVVLAGLVGLIVYQSQDKD